MNVELPTQGCNYFTSTSQFTNYNNNIATTYVINEGVAIATRRQNYTTIPTGYICISNGDIKYKPEFLVYAQFMSIILCAFIGVLLWKSIGRLLGR